METDTDSTIVQIPGEFVATYKDGKIERLIFMPLASHAGYFGPAAMVVDGDESLDVEETEGPFWSAVQQALGAGLKIEWEE